MNEMTVSERNRQIKKALAEEFGYKNVSVKGDRGTAYGWVNIKIVAKKPEGEDCNPGDPYWKCEKTREKIDQIKKRVWQILKETGLDRYLFSFYDDMLGKQPEVIIDVELKDYVEEVRNKKQKIEMDTDGFKVVKEGTWTWLYFNKKPSEEVREKLKSSGFRFSRKRIAWYFIGEIDVKEVLENEK